MRFLRLAASLLLLPLTACSSLPQVAPNTAPATTPTQVEGPRGPLPASRSREILAGLERGADDTGIFDRHLAVEQAVTGTPLVSGNRVRLLEDGPDTYRAMFVAIAAASDHINMETYILEDDEVGRRFADALIAKQREGVQVNLIYDGVGTLGTPEEFFQRLRDSGIRTLQFNPVNPATAKAGWEVNQRDHRKLLIVDGRTVFLGGINISSVYSGRLVSAVAKPRPEASNPGAIPTCRSKGRWWRSSRSSSWPPGSRRRASPWHRGTSIRRCRRRARRSCARSAAHPTMNSA